MKIKKLLPTLLIVALMLAVSMGALAACNPDETPAANKYKVELVYDAKQGVLSLSPSSADSKYDEGAKLTLTVTPGEDYDVDVVTVNDAPISLSEGKYEFVVNADVTIKITFVEKGAKKVDVGAYALKWAGADGVLDLNAQTYSAAEDFKVLEVVGEGAEAQISVEFGAASYTLKLTEDGKLGMYGEGEEPLSTFSVVPEALAGAWEDDSGYNYFYHVIDATYSADTDAFAWGTYAYGENLDGGEGYTAFAFEDGEAVITMDAYSSYSYGYPAYKYKYKNASVQVGEVDWYGDVTYYNFTPYQFDIVGNYLTASGTLTVAEDKLTFNGTEASYELKATKNGAGYAFSANGNEYLLRASADKTYIVGEKIEALVTYSPENLEQEWYTSDGSVVFSAEDGKMNVAGSKTESVDYAVALVDDVIEYSFDCYLGHVTFGVIDGVDPAMTYAVGNTNDYVIAGYAREYFFETMTDNSDVVTITEDQYLRTRTCDENNTTVQNAAFTFVPALGVVAVKFKMDEAPYNGNNAYFVYIAQNVYSVMIEVEDVYLTYSTYFATSVIDDITATFDGGEYTTGGSEEQTVSFDFSGEAKKIIFNGEEYQFMWNCSADDIGVTPMMDFVRVGEDTSDICTLEPLGYGFSISMQTYDRSDEELDAPIAEDIYYFITASAYEDLKGLSFTYKGKYYGEYFSLDENGVFTTSDSDYSDSDSAVKSVSCDYFLQHYYDEYSEREAYVIAFNPYGNLYVYAYVYDLSYGQIVDIVYTPTEVAEFVGSYLNGESVFTVERNTSVTLDGQNVPATFDGASASFTLNDKAYTVQFEDGKATLSVDGVATEYEKIVVNELAFVGTYVIGETEIVVTSSVLTPNLPPTLVVTVDGYELNDYDVTLQIGAKPTLSFSVMGFPDPVPINYTLTLEDGKVVVSNGTTSVSVDQNGMQDYSVFGFDGSMSFNADGTVYDGEDGAEDKTVIVCLKKTGGATPYFYVDGDDITTSTMYSLSYADGVATLQVRLDNGYLKLSYDGEELSVVWEADPLPPPPPPAPPLP